MPGEGNLWVTQVEPLVNCLCTCVCARDLICAKPVNSLFTEVLSTLYSLHEAYIHYTKQDISFIRLYIYIRSNQSGISQFTF